MKISYLLTALASLGLTLTAPAAVIDFSDLTLAPESYTDYRSSGSISSGGAQFNHYYDSVYDSWAGFRFSNITDTTKKNPIYLNQYEAITGTDGNGVAGGIYSILYDNNYTPLVTKLQLPTGQNTPLSIQVTNTAYAYYSMLDGDDFSKKFSALDNDWFCLTISAYNSQDDYLGEVDVYLADFRSTSSEHFILDQWKFVDLTTLGSGVDHLLFTFTSSDVGSWGINTPTYAAIDNLTVVPEPSTWLLVIIGTIFLTWRRPSNLRRA